MNTLTLSSLGRPRDRARIDAFSVLLFALFTFALSSAFELQEKLAALAQRFEAWQLDEAPLTLTALSLGLAWYAWRRRAEAAQLLANNRELAQQLIAVQESERLALARELHDELAQHCTAIRLEAAYIQRALDGAKGDPTLIASAAQRAAQTADVLHESVRRLLRRLRPAELDELGLVAALQAMGADWQARSAVGCVFHHEGELSGLGEAVDTAVYRVAQEALSNVMRHAQASSVRIELRATRAGLELSVADDGRGFDASTLSRGLGLLGAAERAAALGGQLLALGT
ncbi:MAG TPA: histidine kinase, partial [Burkholderiaceae bacterium]|nr:histidine kinase [Burkholderiaceae bacterium]